MSDETAGTLKAFRPSQFGDQENDNPESEMVRLANLRKYAQRAQAGLPIFEEEEKE